MGGAGAGAAGGASTGSSTMSAVGSGVGMLGSVSGAISSYIQPNMAKKTAKKEYGYLSDLTRAQMVADKAIAEKNISLFQDEAMRNTALVGKKAALLEGAQKASSAGMGRGGGSVTDQNLQMDTFLSANADKISIRHGAELARWRIENDLNYSNYTNNIKLSQYDYAINTAKHNAKMSNMAFGISILGGYVGAVGNTFPQVGSMISGMGGQPQSQNKVGGSSINTFGMTSSNFMNSTAYRQAYGNEVPTYGKLTGPVYSTGAVTRGNTGMKGFDWQPTKLE